MTTDEVKEQLFDRFERWMAGQTFGGTPTNPDWYPQDVLRFIHAIDERVVNGLAVYD